MVQQTGRRVVLGVSGASGIELTRTLLLTLRDLPHVETHLVVSSGARLVVREECDDMDEQGEELVGQLEDLADHVHAIGDMGAGPASGSWKHDGMIVCPCSMSSLANIAHGCGTNLLHRAADVTLKERRPLVLIARETPLSLIHVENMRLLLQAGATIMPFMPAFYAKPKTIEDMLRHFCGRILDQIGIESGQTRRWRDNV